MSAALVAILGSLVAVGIGAHLVEMRASARINKLKIRRDALNAAQRANLEKLETIRAKIAGMPTDESGKVATKPEKSGKVAESAADADVFEFPRGKFFMTRFRVGSLPLNPDMADAKPLEFLKWTSRQAVLSNLDVVIERSAHRLMDPHRVHQAIAAVHPRPLTPTEAEAMIQEMKELAAAKP